MEEFGNVGCQNQVILEHHREQKRARHRLICEFEKERQHVSAWRVDKLNTRILLLVQLISMTCAARARMNAPGEREADEIRSDHRRASERTQEDRVEHEVVVPRQVDAEIERCLILRTIDPTVQTHNEQHD